MRAGFDCEVTAGFLKSGRTLAKAANAAAIIAGVGYWYEGPGLSSMGLALSLAFWVVECVLALRVEIDHSLFETFARDPEAAGDWLDGLLVDWKLVKAAKSRDVSERSRGAMRLWRMQRVALVLQLAALAGAMVLRAVNF